MSDNISISIPVPPDVEGFVLLKCPNCGTYFKISPADLNDERILNVFCPSCGLIGDNYLTEDIRELAIAIANNYVMKTVHKEFKKLERQFKKGPIKIKAGKPPKLEKENPIHSGIEAMEKAYFPCCQRTAKIKPLLIMTGCYCPFCGVKNYEIK